MPTFYPIIFVHGWGGVMDVARDFDDRDERDPYVGWNQGRRYNDPDNWRKIRDIGSNFEGMVLRLVKDYNYYDASNDENLAQFKAFLGQSPVGSGAAAPPDMRAAALQKSLWIFRYYEYNADHLKLKPEILDALRAELVQCKYKPAENRRKSLSGIPYYAALLAVKVQQIACPICKSLNDWTDAPGLDLKRVYLVGHSMGGLISRFALQYNLFGMRESVARLGTLCTPHDGARFAIPARILRFLPGMRDDDIHYLDPAWVRQYLKGQNQRVEFAGPEAQSALPDADTYCLVGTRHEGYYPIGRRLPRTDGVVHQDEAFLRAHPWTYLYYTHSGEYGIRENFEPYQALRRFLFGDLRVQMRISRIQLKKPGQFREDKEFFFHYYVKPFGINAHLNEISERAENAPRPRTIAQMNAYFQEKDEGGKPKRYILYDGFADSTTIVDTEGRVENGILPENQQLPHLQVHHESFLNDRFVGGRMLGADTHLIPLKEGTHTFTLEDQVFTATLEVEVKKR